MSQESPIRTVAQAAWNAGKQLAARNPRLYDVLIYLRAYLFGAKVLVVDDGLQFLTRALERPVFVKVGANDGITHDPCGHFFLRNESWRGVLVEPVPYLVERLRRNYQEPRFQIVQSAVGATTGTAPFYCISETAAKELPDLSPWWDQWGSFDREHVITHGGDAYKAFIVEISVPVQPLDRILQECSLTTVDFLHIDTEGADLEVLQTLSFEEYRPLIILIEHKHLSQTERKELDTLLTRYGYLHHEVDFDTLAIQKHLARAVMRRNGVASTLRQLLVSRPDAGASSRDEASHSSAS